MEDVNVPVSFATEHNDDFYIAPEEENINYLKNELKWMHKQVKIERMKTEMEKEDRKKDKFFAEKEKRKLASEPDDLAKKLRKMEDKEFSEDEDGVEGLWFEQVEDLYHEYEKGITMERTKITQCEKRIEKFEVILKLLGKQLKKGGLEEKDFRNPLITSGITTAKVSPPRGPVITID